MPAEENIVSLKINDYKISVRLLVPTQYRNALIIANGAGADMHSTFVKNYARIFSEKDILTVCFNFHYQEIKRKVPDKNEKCRETYLAVIKFLVENYLSEENIVLSGKSMGGRIATQIAHQVNCQKILVFGYPLHPPGKPEQLRDEHLYPIEQQVLVFQGENDIFGNKHELQPVISKMKNARAIFITNGDHSLKVPKKYGNDEAEIKQMITEEAFHFINS